MPAAIGPWRSVEQVSIIAPLGIRFWDPAFDVQVSHGLTVRAYPAGTHDFATTAVCTPSGIFAFRGLPGMHDIEYPQSNPDSPGSLPATAQFLIEVTDATENFLPAAFTVGVPFKGIFPTDLPQGQNAVAPPGFYLFSAPTRSASSTVAMASAQLSELIDSTTEQPASYAVMEIDTPDGDTWVGLADQRGMLALLFTYPTFTGTSSAVSSVVPSAAVPQQSWPVTVRVRYQPSALSFPPGSRVPEMRSVLAQAPAVIWTQRAAPPGQAVASLPATLIFGQQLVIQSAQESELLIGLGSLP